MISNPKRLFLIDGLGAGLSAVLLLLIATCFRAYVGMPQTVLLLLASIAGVFAVYSLCCFLFVRERWRRFLVIITAANSSYCCLTAFFVCWYFPQLTFIDLAYFIAEMAVICGLVLLEMKALTVRLNN